MTADKGDISATAEFLMTADCRVGHVTTVLERECSIEDGW